MVVVSYEEDLVVGGWRGFFVWVVDYLGLVSLSALEYVLG